MGRFLMTILLIIYFDAAFGRRVKISAHREFEALTFIEGTPRENGTSCFIKHTLCL